MRARILSPVLALAILLPAAAALAAGAGAEEPSPWARAVYWVLAEQRTLHRGLTQDLRALAGEGGFAAACALISASFLYGVFHAAGPGHGKAVLTTYLLSHRQQLGRSTALAVAAAFCQGAVAVLLVYGLIYLGGWLPRDTTAAVGWSERLSFAVLLAMGAALCWRAARGLVARRRRNRTAGHLPQVHGHVHPHRHAHGADDDCCGHSHMPSVEQVARSGDLRTAAAVVLSIGLRPCTGAVLVLVFAKVIGLAWAGVAAVAAMSAGTAIAVAALAVVAVKLRGFAVWLVKGRGGGWPMAGDIVALAGGALLFVFGWTLLAASFAPAHPLGL